MQESVSRVPHSPSAPEASAYAAAMEPERLAVARVASLFDVARPAYYATLANAGLLMLVLWQEFPAALLAGWFGLLLAATLARVALHRGFARDAGGPAALHWESRFALGALAAGALWAFPPAVFFPESDPLLQMAVIFVVGGNVIGAAGVYAPSPAAFYSFSALPLAAVLTQLFLQPGRTYHLLALMVLVFGAVMVRVYRGIHAGIVRSLRAQIENEELVARLARSEAQLRDAIESFPEGIAIYDARDHLVVCNDAYAGLYRAAGHAAALSGRHYRELAEIAFEVEAVPADAKREAWVEERVARRRGAGGAVRRFQTRDGRWMQGRFVRCRDGGIVSGFTDVTELLRAQADYGRVLDEERQLLDTLPLGVVFFSNRVITRCNRHLEQMLGYGPGELNGNSSRVLYPSEELWQEAGRRYELLRGGDVLEGEFRLLRKDGSTLRVRSLGRALDPAAPQAASIVTYTDVSERHAAEVALRKSEAMYRNLVETSNDLVWSLDREGRWTYLNPAAVRRIYGCQADDMLGRRFTEVLAREVSERDVTVFQRIFEGESVFDYETRHVRRDGGYIDLSFNALPLRDARGKVTGATGTARDVTREKQAAAALHESVEKLRLAVDAAELLYWEWDRDTDQLQWGRDPSTLVGAAESGRAARWSDFVKLVHDDDRERYLAAVNAAWDQPGTYTSEHRIVWPDGRMLWLSTHGKSLADAAGRVRRMIGVSQDITERKSREEEARFLAYHDTLTGLPNRRLLDDRLRQAVYLAQRRDARVAVMVIDLDHFKQVNDQLGHRAGDSVLREAAHRLAGCVRKSDTLARHGGDEFIVVIPDLHGEADCQVVAEKILRAMAAPFRVDGREFAIGASVGVSLYPSDAGDGEAALRNADVAMYRAKQLGRNNYRFYGR